MIIPEEVLDNLICSHCKKYLSVGPIKVYPNKGVKCGRCIKIDDAGVISRSFEIVVQNITFPCVNRFEGCDKVLKYGEAVKCHEHSCIGIKFECPVCNVEETSLPLLFHFKSNHSKFLLMNTTDVVFDIRNEIEKVYMFVKTGMKQDLFGYIYLRYDRWLKNFYFRTSPLIIPIVQKIQILSLDYNNLWQSKRRIVTTQDEEIHIDLNNKDNNFYWICRFCIEKLSIEMENKTEYLSVNHVIISHQFKHIKKLKNEIEYSPYFMVDDTMWRVFILQRDEHFGLFVEPKDILVVANLYKLTVKFIVAKLENKFSDIMFTTDMDDYGFPTMIERKVLLKPLNNYLNEDGFLSVTVDFHLVPFKR